MIREHDPEICSKLMGKMAEEGTTFVPTHTTRKLDAYALDEAYRADFRLKYIPSPLKNIGAVRGVETVVLAGSFYDHEDLNDMLSKVEANANSLSMWPKFLWQLVNSPITKKQFAD